MKTLKTRLGKLDAEISAAKENKRKQKKRLRILRSYKGDTSVGELLLQTTQDGIAASEAQRDTLVQQLEMDKDEK
jgi:hypothetical protein